MNKRDFLLPVPDPPPDEGDMHVCTFGKAWLPVVLEAMQDLLQEGIWFEPPDDIDAQVDHLIWQIQEETPPVPQLFPTSAMHFHTNSHVDTGNAIAFIIDTAQIFNFSARQNAAAQGDLFSFDVLLAAGGYELHICWLRTASSGILTCAFDGETLGDIDMFGTAARNQLSIFEINIAEAGLKNFVGVVNSKNGGSSNYHVNITYFKFVAA